MEDDPDVVVPAGVVLVRGVASEVAARSAVGVADGSVTVITISVTGGSVGVAGDETLPEPSPPPGTRPPVDPPASNAPITSG